MRTATALNATLVLIVALVLAAEAPAGASGRTHVVQPGETLYRIALRYGVTVEVIARANALPDPTRIFPGQTLTIPTAGTRERGNEGTRKAERSRSSVRASAVPVRPRSHIAARGDTLYAIARRYGTTVAALMQANGLRSDTIHAGQSLLIPGTQTPPAPKPAGPRPAPQPIPPKPARVVTMLPAPSVGDDVPAPKPLRVRRGPKSYFTTLALAAAQTPLHVLSEENGWYEVQLPTGDVGWVYTDDLRKVEQSGPADESGLRGADIVREAMRYLGTPYVWGGESTGGVDCSGFVYIVFVSRVPGLARMSSFDYFQMGVAVDRANLQPGDLVFFTTYAPGPSHVGIYVGEGKFIQASSGTRRVTISSLDEPYYTARYLGARRLMRP